jgi:two-component system sensor histidine kinase KdpD
LYETLAVAAALAIGELLTALTPIPNLSMLFLMAVLLVAVSYGVWPAIFASTLSFLVYNFFFIEALHTFSIAEPCELLALVIFLVVAVITSARRAITADTALMLARVFGNSADFWLNLQRRNDLWEALHSPERRQRIERARPVRPAVA